MSPPQRACRSQDQSERIPRPSLGGLELIVHFTPAALTLPADLISLTNTVMFVRTQPCNLQGGLKQNAVGGVFLLPHPLSAAPQ